MNSDKKHRFDDIQTTISYERGSVTLFKQWLFENYRLRVNSLDPDDVYLEPTEVNPQEYKYAITENDIYLHALEDGIKITKSLINSIIASPNHSEHFNPIKEYFDKLQGTYKGQSQLDYLIDCLHLDEGQDAEKCRYIIKKWFVAMAACALGMRQNDVALGIISDRAGIGKTTFFEEIVPASLHKYMHTILKTSNNQIPEHTFGTKFLLNLDELAALTSSTESQFKMLMSSREITSKIPGTRRSTLVQRIASVCFTSNKTSDQGGFIRSNDPGIMRRLAVIEVKDIEDYRELLDVDMLWAEVITLLRGGFNYEWNMDDYKYFTSVNKKYIISTNAMRIVRMYYNVPRTNDKIKHMSSRDVLLHLKQKRRIPSAMTNVDEVSIGQALSSLGFRRVIKRIQNIGPRYVYEMKASEID